MNGLILYRLMMFCISCVPIGVGFYFELYFLCAIGIFFFPIFLISLEKCEPYTEAQKSYKEAKK